MNKMSTRFRGDIMSSRDGDEGTRRKTKGDRIMERHRERDKDAEGEWV